MISPIREVRIALRLTQGRIAAACGVTRSLWSMHESKSQHMLATGGEYDVIPRIARPLIAFARTQGMPLLYEHLYEGLRLPTMALRAINPSKRKKRPPKVAATPVVPPALRPRRRVIVSSAIG